MTASSPTTVTLSDPNLKPQILRLEWDGWVELRKMLFEVLESEQITSLLSIAVGVISKESAAGSGEVADPLLEEQDAAAGLMAKAMAVDWDAVIESGVPALARSARQLNELDVRFIRTFVLLCSTLTDEQLGKLPAMDVYKVFDAASEVNSLIEHVKAEKNLFAALLSALGLATDEE